MSYINDLANKGRLGDTKIRHIDGELQHVNKEEASWIDNYGLLGQEMTKAQGSQTINPETGLKENNPWWLIGTGLAALMSTSDKKGWGRLNPGNWNIGFGRMRNSSLGKAWDNTLGRDSALFGGKSKKKRKALASIKEDIAEVEARKEKIFPDAMGKFNQSTMNDWNTLQSNKTASPITLASDTGKNFNFQNQIQNAVNNTNASLTGAINNAQDRLWKQEDQIADLNAEEQSIRNS